MVDKVKKLSKVYPQLLEKTGWLLVTGVWVQPESWPFCQEAIKENPHTAVLRKILQEAFRSLPHTLTSSEDCTIKSNETNATQQPMCWGCSSIGKNSR